MPIPNCPKCDRPMVRRTARRVANAGSEFWGCFDVGKGGKAEPGTRYKSRLHKIDNLQAAHTYCNNRKGNTPEVNKWRHPAMSPLTVADAQDGTALVLPRKPKT